MTYELLDPDSLHSLGEGLRGFSVSKREQAAQLLRHHGAVAVEPRCRALRADDLRVVAAAAVWSQMSPLLAGEQWTW